MQQAPAAQLTCAQAPAGELLGHRSPARSRTAFATRPSRSSCCPLTASAPARQIPPVKQTPRTRCGYRGYAFFCNLPYPQVCMHEVHGWELESGRAGGLGANSSWYGGSSTYPWSSSSCVLLALRPNEPGASTRRARHSTLWVVLELEHVKPVDQRSAIRKADAVLPAFTRAGQHHDTLKRVTQRGRCRLLFLFGVKHVHCKAFEPS